MNVLCLGSEVVGPELAADLIKAFLGAEFIGGGRYERRRAALQRVIQLMIDHPDTGAEATEPEDPRPLRRSPG
mgnify:CR=1 FL=1